MISTGFTWQCGGMAQVVELLVLYTIVKPEVTGLDNPGVSHQFRIVRIIIPASLIKQTNGTLSRNQNVCANIYSGLNE